MLLVIAASLAAVLLGLYLVFHLANSASRFLSGAAIENFIRDPDSHVIVEQMLAFYSVFGAETRQDQGWENLGAAPGVYRRDSRDRGINEVHLPPAQGRACWL
eukprot:249886-Amorphochlora_amoeboformis.AAC.1